MSIPPVPQQPPFNGTLANAPATPATGINLGALSLGGGEVPAFQPAHGCLRMLQPHLGRGAWGSVSFGYNSTSVIYGGIWAVGGAPTTYLGTAAGAAYASTNYGTMQPRASYFSAATAGATAGLYTGASIGLLSIGNGSGLGGGQFIARFMFGDTVASPLALVGLTSGIAAPSATTDPSVLTNLIAVGVSQAVANPTHLYLFYGGSAAQAPIDLGASFPANTANADFYELIVFSDPITGQTGATVNRYTGSAVPVATFSQIIANTSPGTTLPAALVQMTPRAWRSNNATAAAVTISFSQFFISGQT